MPLSRRQFLTSVAVMPVASGLATTANAQTHAVSIQNFRYSPSSLTISAGDTVSFTNLDNAPHTATSSDANLDTGTIARNQSADLTFATAGTYTYICSFHRSMRGTIIVT